MNTIRIVLADSHAATREQLIQLIGQEAGMTVIGQAANGPDAVTLASALHPDIVILDVVLPQFNGIEATRQIMGCSPQTRVIAWSLYDSQLFVREVMKAGGAAYVNKDSSLDDLLIEIRRAASGRSRYSSNTASK